MSYNVYANFKHIDACTPSKQAVLRAYYLMVKPWEAFA